MQAIFTTLGVPPKVYQAALIKEFGQEWLTWLPETLYAEIARVWGVSVIPEVANKINALKVFLTTDLFYSDAPVFEHIVLSMNDALVDPELLNLSTPSEILYAIFVLGPLDESKFGREVIGYVRICCDNFGLVVYPTNLAFAQPTYTNPELVAMIPKIHPVNSEGPTTDPVVQQSRKLYAVIQDTVDRLAAFNPSVIGVNQ